MNKTEILNRFHEFIKSSDGQVAENVTEFYDNWVSESDYDKYSAEIAYRAPEEVARVMSENLMDRSVRILDCGCGTGMVADKLHSFGFNNIVGLDLSEKSLEVARKKGLYKECVNDKSENMRFESNAFDALVSVGCFFAGHMTQTSFPEWIRVVKPGGLIFLSIRASAFETQEPYKDGKLLKAISDFEQAEKWKLVSKVEFPNYINNTEVGNVFIWKVI